MFLRSDSADVEFINGFVAFLAVDLVELGYVDWVVEIDGVFENGGWTVRGKKFICLNSEPRKTYSESN